MVFLRVGQALLVSAAVCAAIPSASAESVSDYAVRVSASVQSAPPRITLSWPADANTTNYVISRKARDDAAWGPVTTLPAGTSNYVDSTVSQGSGYEYRIYTRVPAYAAYTFGYIYSGIEMPLVESRGKLILLVDNSVASSVTAELDRLHQDLIGDGWAVIRHDVSRSDSVTNIKALITADYNADPANVKSVFLFGHVPVPYSGDFSPDGHSNHNGAWPADLYYGDMLGSWSDSSVNDSFASDPRNRNVPGDGKFDAIIRPGNVDLQVGRVDLANLPAFAQSETELLRQYLNKDHNFRHKLITVELRGLIDDHFGISNKPEVSAVNGWRNFAPFFGATGTAAGPWFSTLSTQSYLWGYACGPGTFTSASGVGSTAEFAANDPKVVFTMMFGSYFGDWDSQNNFLRAPLATPTYTLSCVWAGRPYWQFHHMALGETIGFSTRLVQNNSLNYDPGSNARRVHIALMGDPTLRMHVVAPPTNLVAVANGSGGVDLNWNPSPDAVLGYHVYRATNAAGPFMRVNGALITGTSYTDSASTATNYMVRAVNLEVSGSGSYTNASQGIFQTVSLPSGLPVLTITAQSTNKVYGAPLPEFTASYSGFVNGDTTNNLTAQAVFNTTATAGSPAGNYPITASGASSPNYTIVYVPGTLTVTPAATTGSLTSSANPALPGASVSFTMTLNALAPGVGTPTGNVQFKVDGANAGSPVALSGGSATYVTSSLAHGTHAVVAEYAGDGNFTRTTNSLASSQVINTPPVAGADTIERDPTNGVKTAIATLLGNDTDADADLLTFLGASATSANGGTVVSNGGWIFYTPALAFTNIDTFTYTIGDGIGVPVIGTVTVNVRLDNGPSPNLTITNLGNGLYTVQGDGIPDRTYRIQFADDSNSPIWQTLATATADPSGVFGLIDTSGSPQRFYRSVYP